MAFIIVIPAWVYAVFMPVHTNCPLHQLIVYSLQSLWVPQFLLRTHNPHVLVLQVIYALTCRTLQVLIALLLHTPRAMLVVAIWAWEGLWWVLSVEALFGMEPSMFLQHNKYDGDKRAMPIGEQAWDVLRLILWSSLSTWAHVTFVPHSYQSSLFTKFILSFRYSPTCKFEQHHNSAE